MGKTTEQVFGGDRRRFRLGIGELRELQEKCQAGPATIAARLMSYQPQAADVKRPMPKDFAGGISDPDFIAQLNLFAMLRSIGGDWRVDDIRETIRLGLIGAGSTPTDAYLLVARYIDETEGGVAGNIDTAAAILMHALLGETGDPVGKEPAEKDATQATDA